MPSPKTYATAGAFRRALEERLKRASLTDQIDPNRLRRQVSFDRLLARLFREESAPWVLKGGYALELRFKAARSTVDIDLTVQRVAASASGDQNQVVREMLQSAADISLGDWFIIADTPGHVQYTRNMVTGASTADLAVVLIGVLAGSCGIVSKLEWTNGSSPDSTWTRALVTWLCDRWKQSCAGTGWDSPASNRRVS